MCGTYRSILYDITLTSEHDRAFLIYRPRSEIAESFLGGSANRVEVVRLNDSSVITAEPKSSGYQVLSLVGSGHGRARFPAQRRRRLPDRLIVTADDVRAAVHQTCTAVGQADERGAAPGRRSGSVT
ncbi:hypothetical protein [Nonomuraea sp. bgisy101]|uniref:hypothetical protein n=1 Tax=Nonomuraea sp. bgisy101 TaxID=3413784 RepID=UPI003D7621B6